MIASHLEEFYTSGFDRDGLDGPPTTDSEMKMRMSDVSVTEKVVENRTPVEFGGPEKVTPPTVRCRTRKLNTEPNRLRKRTRGLQLSSFHCPRHGDPPSH